MPRLQHRSLPADVQPWANRLDDALDEIDTLKAQVAKLLELARVDPRDPGKRSTPQTQPPSAAKQQDMRLSGLGDADTMRVINGQVLTWDQSANVWKPKTPDGAFDADVSITPLFNVSTAQVRGYGRGAGVTQASGQPYSYWGYDAASGDLAAETNDGGGRTGIVTTGFNRDITLYSRDAAWTSGCQFTVNRNMVKVQGGPLAIPMYATADRPTVQTAGLATVIFDSTLNKPIWRAYNDVWRDASGAAV